jgi:CBS domain-containing protein
MKAKDASQSVLLQSVTGAKAKPLITCSPDTRLVIAFDLMQANQIHNLIVTDDAKIVGMLSASDVLHGLQTHGFYDPAEPVSKWMTKDVPLVDDDTDLREVLLAMRRQGLSAVPVVKQGRATGVLTLSDLLFVLQTVLESEETEVQGPPLDSWRTFLAHPAVQSAMKLLGDAGL